MADRFTPRRGDVRDPGPNENPDAGRYDGQSDDMESVQAEIASETATQGDQNAHGPIVSPTGENAGSRPTGIPYVGRKQPSQSDSNGVAGSPDDPMEGVRESSVSKLPWAEQGILLKDGPRGVREIVLNGTLALIAQHLGNIDKLQWKSYHVSLADRQAPPYEFRSDEIGSLVLARTLD